MDLSNQLVAHTYPSAVAGDFFYVWFNNDAGAVELFFATSLTSSTPTDYLLLVNLLKWDDDTGLPDGSGLTIVRGANINSAAEKPKNDFGNGTGGIGKGYEATDFFSVSYTPPPDSTNAGCWEQNMGVTTITNTINRDGDSWPTSTGLYRLVIRNDGGFNILPAAPICYHGDSMIKVLNKQTNVEEYKKARDVTDSDFVYSVTRNKFVNVLLNMVTYGNKKYIVLKKGLLGDNKPSDDFYITNGHPVLYNGKETPVEKIPGAKEYILNEQEAVYSIVTSIREYIMVNGLETMTWSYNGWRNAYLNGSHKIYWTNGQKEHKLNPMVVKMFSDKTIRKKNVSVSKNAFGKNIPKNDMSVNENYELLVDGKKTKIKEFINGVTIKFNH